MRVAPDQRAGIVDEYLAPGSRTTLTEALTRLGLTHRPNDRTDVTGKRDVVRNGRVVFTGTCFETNEWLSRGGDWGST